jgi:hypothetical protein
VNTLIIVVKIRDIPHGEAFAKKSSIQYNTSTIGTHTKKLLTERQILRGLAIFDSAIKRFKYQHVGRQARVLILLYRTIDFGSMVCNLSGVIR